MFTLPLLYVGGSVTTYRVGLAVPDWPTTFGINMFLFDFWNAPFGVRVEHTHRLYGAAVGLATIVLAGWLLVFEPRRWMKGLGVLALVARDRSGSAGRDAGDAGLDVPGGRSRLHGAGVLRPDGRPVRLDRPGLARADERRRPIPITCGRCARSSWAWCTAQIVLGSWLRHYGTPRGALVHAALAAGGLGRVRLFLAFGSSGAGGPRVRWSRRRGRWRLAVDAPDRSGYRRAWFTCCRLTELPGRCRFIRPWSGPVIRPTGRCCWRRRSC